MTFPIGDVEFSNDVEFRGKVGIGTNNPTAGLEVAAASGGTFRVSDGGGALSFIEIQAPSSSQNYARIRARKGGTQSRDLVLQEAGGRVGIGTTSPGFLLHVNGTAGKPGGGSWSNASDARLKDVKREFTRGLEAIDELNPVYYNYKKGNPINLPSEKEHVGLIAQEVEKVIPEAVGDYQDGFLSVNNDPILWTMLNAIKELKSENKAAREELSQTKAELNDLKTKVNKLESQFSQTAMLTK